MRRTLRRLAGLGLGLVVAAGCNADAVARTGPGGPTRSIALAGTPAGAGETGAEAAASPIVALAHLPLPVSHHTATVLRSGWILVTGGFDGHRHLSETFLLQPDTGDVIQGPSMALPRVYHSATELSDGSVLLAGGTDGNHILSTVEVFLPDPDGDGALADSRILGAPDLPSPRARHVAVRVPGLNVANLEALTLDEVLLVGGITEGRTGSYLVSSVDVYEPVRTNGFDLSRSAGTVLDEAPAFARIEHTATLLPGTDGRYATGDERLLVYGGRGVAPRRSAADGRTLAVLADAEVYDPWRDEWLQVPATATTGHTELDPGPRRGHGATVLPDGSVLILGGANDEEGPPPVPGDDRVRRAERFIPNYADPTASRLEPDALLATARRAPAVTPLPDGRVLVTGGFDAVTGEVPASVEIYVPGTPARAAAFVPAGAMAVGRIHHTASPVPPLAPAPRVVLLGGLSDAAGTRITRVDLYQP